ncbi:response regulator transcription factor [Acidocella aminolytica]|jgi:DNA-binding NarL/FixJ family response regulator|uniref:Two component transcriptional regulator LuxR n=1 Tax=Acidocella aminolytica 101 = DSM 11237 TaxID=1120923 RepID=A0A0D6PDX4_9PROT|nr:DNA-binding response regulator [Acidocella aminolytica]GAN79960.1 two component transcriptional regulator LuxR [Acidocella aminolytica 101 = DSM 11237]GBQ38249.1 two component response regulator [Acidocella aminolytica 101 = DSM 11237]SHE58300.1 two component transcriptional regulator, LuxR family [Acidocella aminolytica 101 = DSM 11237]
MPPDPSARPTILIVDDDPAMLRLLIDALEPAGFNVLVALQGEMALVLLEQVTPDVILLDALMPGIDGFETCRRLKRRPGLTLVPVIFMTGLTDTENVVSGLQAGGVDYVTKPVIPGELIARIRVHLANAQLTRSAQRAMDAAGRFLLAADAKGRMRWSTYQAALLLGDIAPGTELPAEVQAWLATRLTQPQEVPGSITIALPAPNSPTRRVEFVLIGQMAEDEFLLRIVEQDTDHDFDRLQARVPLTRRETEVLLWLARGKSNRDIAQILNVSYRTVNKHLEQMYPKLGVETRTSAVAIAVRALEGA